MHDEGGLLLILPIFGQSQRQHFCCSYTWLLSTTLLISSDKRFRPALARVVLGLLSLLILPESSTSVSFLYDKNRFKHCFLMSQ